MPTLKWLTVDIGDEIAFMPASNSPPYAVLGIQQAVDVGSVFIQLKDGGMFYRLGGAEKNGSRFITEATNEHRAAVKDK